VNIHGKLFFPKNKRKRPIRVGPARGSAAGSLIIYEIGITSVDPIPYKLLFERFLNPDRVGWPDIDIDFETDLTVLTTDDDRELDGRDAVKEFLKITQGHDHVADIIAYQTFAPRRTIKDIGAVFDINYKYLEDITKSIGDTERGLEKIANGNPDKDVDPNELVADLREKHSEAWGVMLKVEDQVFHDTRHAAGLVITPKPINYYMPTQIAVDEETVVTAWSDRAEFPVVSDYGFMKYDILGVKSLAKQELSRQLIQEYYDEDFEPNDLSIMYDPDSADRKVLNGFVQGITLGVFQFAGRPITQLLRHIKPDCVFDIIVANAIFRPGSNKVAFEYADRKHGLKPITYWHDSLEPILSETYGLMCLQEQAMEICKQVGNFTGGQADSMRKAMAKLYRLPGDKAQEFMAQFKEQWHKGCYENGLREEEAEFIWTDRMLPLGDYLFPRAHSAGYGLQAVQDMHFKMIYPLAFYPASLTIHRKQKKEDQQEFLKSMLREARIFDIEAIPPHINKSKMGWSVELESNQLRYGLVSITGMGRGLAQQVIDNREFLHYQDFVQKIPSGFGADKMVALAKAGAFDETDERADLLSRVRQWDHGVIKVKAKMTCGHLRSKTFKQGGDPQKLADEWAAELECKSHPEAEVAEVKILDDTYELARYYKDHVNGKPEVISVPDDEEINQMEEEALNISLYQGSTILRYKPFLDRRIYTEEEVEDLPSAPARRGKKHGVFCACKECEASFCIVGGEIVAVKRVLTKKNREPMAFIDVAHDTSQYSCTLFPFIFAKYEEILNRPTAFLIAGKKQLREGKHQVVVAEMKDVIEVANANGWNPDRPLTGVINGRGR
jgi:DNA-directed DNA polymerase III PolC